jgi:hypothetical protein
MNAVIAMQPESANNLDTLMRLIYIRIPWFDERYYLLLQPVLCFHCETFRRIQGPCLAPNVRYLHPSDMQTCECEGDAARVHKR